MMGAIRIPALVLGAALVAAAHGAAAQSALEAPTRALVEAFQAHCLANLADFGLVREAAESRSWEPVPPKLLERLKAKAGWFLPSRHGEVVLGLSANGGCGLTTGTADPALAAGLLAERLPLEPLAASPGAGRGTTAFRLTREQGDATLRVVGFSGRAQGMVALLVRPTPQPAPAVAAAEPEPEPPSVAPRRPAVELLPPAAPALAPPDPAVQPPAFAEPPSALRSSGVPGLRSSGAATAEAGSGSVGGVGAAAKEGTPSLPLAGAGELPGGPLATLGASAETGGSAVARNLPLPPLPSIGAGRAPPAIAGAPPRVQRPAPGWDPNADSVENLAAKVFDDVCYRPKSDLAAIEARARDFDWAPIDREATIRAGFDRGWEMPAPTGETLMVLYDPLGPKCCVSIFPAEASFLTAAVGVHYGLEEPRKKRVRTKQVLVYRPRGTWQITMDFEDIPDRGTFASVCYTQR